MKNHANFILGLLIICNFIFPSCQKNNETEVLLKNHNNLPANFNNELEDPYESFFYQLYDIIESIREDTMLLNLIDSGLPYENLNLEEITNSQYLSDIEATPTFLRMDSLVEEFWGYSITDMGIGSGYFSTTIQSLSNSGYVGFSQLNNLVASNILTDGETVAIFLNCCIHNYIIEQNKLCYVTLDDGSERVLEMYGAPENYFILPFSYEPIVLNIHVSDAYEWSHEDIPNLLHPEYLIDTLRYGSFSEMYVSFETIEYSNAADCYAAWTAEYHAINAEYEAALNNLTASVNQNTDMQTLQTCMMAITVRMEQKKEIADGRLRECLNSANNN